MTRMVALLRGINVAGTRKLPIGELRTVAEAIGLTEIGSYIQSGNLVFTAPNGFAAPVLERAIEDRFGFAVPVILRDATAWRRYAAGSPFPQEEADASNRLMLVLGSAPPKPQGAAALMERASGGERIVADGDALWVHYPNGAGTSRLTPAMFDRMMGGVATARNWNTVRRLATMLGVTPAA